MVVDGGHCRPVAAQFPGASADPDLPAPHHSVAGAGQGISFSRGLAAVAERTPADRRAEVSSAYFFIVYIGLSLPVIGEGLAAEAWGLRTAGTVFALAVATLTAVCLAAVLVEERMAARR